jgi:glyceraldehyde-3-phosphate dehydrogenase/erythrose-4-phosphate dehydrogenase
VAALKALPGLAGRFGGAAVRVPIPIGSIADVAPVTARQMIREAFAALGLAAPDLSQVRP